MKSRARQCGSCRNARPNLSCKVQEGETVCVRCQDLGLHCEITDRYRGWEPSVFFNAEAYRKFEFESWYSDDRAPYYAAISRWLESAPTEEEVRKGYRVGDPEAPTSSRLDLPSSVRFIN